MEVVLSDPPPIYETIVTPNTCPNKIEQYPNHCLDLGGMELGVDFPATNGYHENHFLNLVEELHENPMGAKISLPRPVARCRNPS